MTEKPKHIIHIYYDIEQTLFQVWYCKLKGRHIFLLSLLLSFLSQTWISHNDDNADFKLNLIPKRFDTRLSALSSIVSNLKIPDIFIEG